MALSPLNQRRWRNFKANRRAFSAFWIFLAIFLVTLCAEFVANDKPLVIRFQDGFRFPIFSFYSEADFGGEFGSARALTSVVRADLERSGVFRMVDTSGISMTETTSPGFGDWKNRGADALAAGSVKPDSEPCSV